MNCISSVNSLTKDIVFEALNRIFNHQTRFQSVGKKSAHFFHEVINNYTKFDQLFDLLEDNVSRQILSWLIKYRIAVYFFEDKQKAGDLFPPIIGAKDWENYKELSKERDVINNLKLQLEVDVIENWILDGYVLPGICGISEGDVIIDCGAFNGNSSLSLADKCGDSGLVYAFEPNPSVFNILNENISVYAKHNITTINLGLAKSKGKIRFRTAGAASTFDPNGNIEIDTISIDEFVRENDISQVDFIKFDVEGSEMNVLKGSIDTIKYFRPKIAISVYHLHNDLSTIPFFILNTCPWYNVYLRHNARHDGEVVLFAVPISNQSSLQT
jgi:FkbM family methyltransferase